MKKLVKTCKKCNDPFVTVSEHDSMCDECTHKFYVINIKNDNIEINSEFENIIISKGLPLIKVLGSNDYQEINNYHRVNKIVQFGFKYYGISICGSKIGSSINKTICEELTDYLEVNKRYYFGKTCIINHNFSIIPQFEEKLHFIFFGFNEWIIGGYSVEWTSANFMKFDLVNWYQSEFTREDEKHYFKNLIQHIFDISIDKYFDNQFNYNMDLLHTRINNHKKYSPKIKKLCYQ